MVGFVVLIPLGKDAKQFRRPVLTSERVCERGTFLGLGKSSGNKRDVYMRIV